MTTLLPPPRSIFKASRRLNPCTDLDVDLLAVKRGAGASSQTEWNAGTLSNTVAGADGRVRLAETGSSVLFQSPGVIANATSMKTICDGTNDSTLWLDFWPDPSVIGPNGFILKSIDFLLQRGVAPHITPETTPIFQVRVTQFDDDWNREDLVDPILLLGSDLWLLGSGPSGTGIVTIDFRNRNRFISLRAGTVLSRTGSGRDSSGAERSEQITIENNKKVSHILVNKGFSIGLVQLNNQFIPQIACLPAGFSPVFDVTKSWRCTEPIGKSMGPYSPNTNGASALDTSAYPGYGYAETWFVPGANGTAEDYGAKNTSQLTAGSPNGKWGISQELHKQNINHVGLNIFDQPYHVVKVVNYASTGTAKVVLNLGAAPTNEVHLRADASTPTGTSITYSVRGSTNGSSWSAPWSALDGDIFTGAQLYQYYEVTATLNATPDALNTPVLTAIFVTERVRYMTWRYARDFDSVSIVDPTTGQSSIGELKLPLLKLGRGDCRDLVTRVVSDYPMANIEAWVYLRNVVTNERYFLNFYRLENRMPSLGEESLVFVSGLDRLKVTVPPLVMNLQYPLSDQNNATIQSHTYNSGTKVVVITVAGTPFAGQNIVGWRFHGVTGALAGIDFFVAASPAPTSNSFAIVVSYDSQEPSNGDLFHLYSGTTTRQAVDYGGVDFAAVYNDLISVQAQVPARLIGTTPATTSRLSVGRLTSDGRAALDPLQEVALHAGGAIGWVRGRINYFDIYGPKTSVETWNEKDYYSLDPAVGADRRMPSVDVKYDYDWVQTKFASEITYNDGDALLGLGRANLFDIFNLPDSLCQWNNSTEADHLAKKMLNAWSTGVRIWNVKLVIPRPWREMGDCVTISTDQYTDRVLKFTADGITDKGTPIRGRVSALGIIVGKNLLGTEFAVAIPGLSNIVVTNSTGGITSDLPVASPTGVTVTSRTDRPSLKVAWTDVTTPGVNEYQCQYRKNGDSGWIEAFHALPATGSLDIPGLNPGTSYDIQIRAAITQLGAFSPWVQVLNTQLTYTGAAVPQGTVSIDANGVYGWTIDLPLGAASCKYGVQTGGNTLGYIVDATVAASGTVLNGRSAIGVNAAGTLSFGQTVWITIVPFTGAGGTGLQLNSIHIRGSYVSYTATKTQNYGPAAWTPTNKDFFPATPVTVDYHYSHEAYATPASLGTSLAKPDGGSQVWEFTSSFAQAPGCTLTQVAIDAYSANDGISGLIASLWYSDANGIGHLLQSHTAANIGWETLPLNVSDSTSGRKYYARCLMDVHSSLGPFTPGDLFAVDSDTRVSGFTVTWSMPDPKQTL